MRKQKTFLCALCAAGAVLVLCAGSVSAENVQETKEEDAAAITADSYKTVLEQVASGIRYAGTDGEKEAAQEIAESMESFGYEVECQTFSLDDGTEREATNVIAVKKADQNANGDILIVSAHHDTRNSTVGANDDGSGTALLLELARIMRDTQSDTEIRFISFSAEEEGLKGSSWYVSQLSDEEKERIVGDIQIDMIGHYGMDETMVKTTQGEENLLVELIREASKEAEGTAWETGTEAASDHSAFTFAGIPAVLVTQNGIGAENHRFSDQPDIIDAETAVAVGTVLQSVLAQIASEETDSLCEKSQEMLAEESAAVIEDSTPILLGAAKTEAEVKAGVSGVFEREEYREELDWTMEHYVAQARWFGWEEALPTDFVYRELDGGGLYLEEVYIRTASLGLTDEELSGRMTKLFGEPETTQDGGSIWGSTDMAKNPSLRRYQITEQDGEQALMVLSDFHTEMGEDLASYDFHTDISEYEDSCDETDLAILTLMHKIIPKEDAYIGNVISWTDGYSYILGSCTPRDASTLTCFDIRVDRNDFLDEDGNIIDTGKLLATMIHEYGHALTLNADQIDVSKLGDYADYSDPEIYREDSYLAAFYEKFYADGKQRDYSSFPEDYVDDYAGNGAVYEDIAESFMVFVTAEKPEGDTLADEKVRFFYDYPELVKIRDYICGNFEGIIR